MIKKFIKSNLVNLGVLLTRNVHAEVVTTNYILGNIKNILIDSYIQKNLFENPKYFNHKKLTKYEFQVYSQNGEDGIIQEIFTRIGTTDKFFVEFGVQNGLECNSLFLLLQDWRGCWLDCEDRNINAIRQKFGFLINEKMLSVKKAFISAENIEELFYSLKVPKEFDLLSIDIDGNDYWIWNSIEKYSPRVVVIEYNAMFRPPVEFIVKYEANKFFPSTSHFGASLKSMEILGSKKGYKLVGCNFNGVNAFFVREDLVRDNFLKPFTAETHYEPPRYFLLRKNGCERDFGKFEDTSFVSKFANKK